MTNARVKAVFGGLSREDARTMAEQIFPGQIDLKRVKFLIEQTKFWPVYGRDKVYTKSTSRGTVDGQSSGWGSSQILGAADMWDPVLEQWVPSSMSSGSGEMSSGSTSSADVFNESEGEADIPVTRHKAFKEISSITPYSL